MALGLLAYSNSFDAPFQFDDNDYIGSNPLIRGFPYPSDMERSNLNPNIRISKETRYISYLSFALDYAVHGLDVTGYHAVNLALHLLNALLVYLFVVLTFRTPRLCASDLKRHSGPIAIFTALLFAAHPVQTEAVTYISQRFTSLAAFFYLSTLSAYAASRLSPGRVRRGLFYALGIISAVSAMKTKEIAFTLPVVVVLYEALFLSGTPKKRLLALFPFALTMLIIPLGIIDTQKPLADALAQATRTQHEISRHDYLATQARVVVTYLRLLALPVNQNVDYDYPVSGSFLEPQVLIPSMFHLSAIGLFVYLISRLRKYGGATRLISFGGLWFFVTLSVESSAIALSDVIFEHRLYLPSVGVFLGLATLAYYWADKTNRAAARVSAFFAILVFLFLCASYSRNAVWQSETGLWTDVVDKSPYKARGHNNLGMAYISGGLIDKAIGEFETAVALDPSYDKAHLNLGNAYRDKGLVEKSIEHHRRAVELRPDMAEAYFNLANTYRSTGRIDEAIEHYLEAVRYRPDFAEAWNNLGLVYLYYRDQPYKAIEQFAAALASEPDKANAHENIAAAYRQIGMAGEADYHEAVAKKLYSSRKKR